MEYLDDEERRRKEIEYGWKRKLEIYEEVEAMWQAYLLCINYPRTTFKQFIMKHNKISCPNQACAGYLIWVWELVKRYKAENN